MIIRAIDVDGDWTFGKGANDYLSGVAAVTQDLQTRLREFLGDCFFNTQAGVDWFNLLGAKNKIALDLAVSAVILNTQNITGLVELSIVLDKNRKITMTYSVTTVFGGLLKGTIGLLLDELGNFLTDESGNRLHG